LRRDFTRELEKERVQRPVRNEDVSKDAVTEVRKVIGTK
jgi:hypothetical protein